MPFVYQPENCLKYRHTKGMTRCPDQRCQACNGIAPTGLQCEAGAGGPFRCELYLGHVGSHFSAFKWDSD